MLERLQCIIGRFWTEVAILKFSRERFTLVCLRILKRGDPAQADHSMRRILIDEFFSLSLRRIWASSLQQFPRKSMLKSQKQLSQYDRCKTQRPKECRPFQIYQSALCLQRQPAAVFPPFKSAGGSQTLIGRFETACIPWIPLVAEFCTDHIEKAVFVT